MTNKRGAGLGGSIFFVFLFWNSSFTKAILKIRWQCAREQSFIILAGLTEVCWFWTQFQRSADKNEKNYFNKHSESIEYSMGINNFEY